MNGFRLADPGIAVDRPPVLLAPMAAILGDRIGRMAMSTQMMRGILDSIANRLDEARDLSRYLTGLLIFLGLLGTFWGLIETVSSVGKVVEGCEPGGDSASMFETLREGLAAPLGGMGISFSSSLFGLAGSLVLGFLDLQTSQAQNRFYTDLEDWLSTTVRDIGGETGRCRASAVRPTCGPRSSACAKPSPTADKQGRDRRDGQSRRGDPGSRAAHAHRAADDPRLGRRAGRAERGNPQGAATSSSRERT